MFLEKEFELVWSRTLRTIFKEWISSYEDFELTIQRHGDTYWFVHIQDSKRNLTGCCCKSFVEATNKAKVMISEKLCS